MTIAVLYLLGTCITAGRGDMVLRMFGFLVLCFACIWFSEEMGSFTGYIGWAKKISRASPGGMVVFMGWYCFFCPPL